MKKKTCSKCKKKYPSTPDYFHRNRRGPDGLRPDCKICMSKYQRLPHVKAKNAVFMREYSRTPRGREASARWRETEKYKEGRLRSSQKYREAYPQRKRANDCVQKAVKRKGFPRATTKSCNYCHKQAAVYHHWSYLQEHWLDVIPVCRMCHAAIHKGELQDRPKQLPMF